MSSRRRCCDEKWILREEASSERMSSFDDPINIVGNVGKEFASVVILKFHKDFANAIECNGHQLVSFQVTSDPDKPASK